MAMTMQQLEAELFRLDIQSRAKLAEKLILSIDAPNEEENLQLWVAEAERRLADLRAGKAREIPAEEVFRCGLLPRFYCGSVVVTPCPALS